jgi:hypothetical protein
MTRRVLGLVGWGLACAATLAGAQAPEEATLKARGLTREKGTYVHISESEVHDKVEELTNAYNKLRSAQYKLAGADQNTAMIAELNEQSAYLQQEKNALSAQSRNLPRVPRGGSYLRRSMQAQIHAQEQQEQQAINATKQQLNAMKKAAPTPEARKAMQDDVTKARDEMARVAAEARTLIDESHASYAALGKDEAIKAALARVKATTTDAIKLGPSKEFHAAEKAVAAAERLLGSAKADPSRKNPKAKERAKP